ncbi:MAG: type IV pilin-like G/H family protein [Kaiparowitsia implicata GSE-PSE-MK54-09C]|jgi:prepilin-type N-terminal cleavage/methylation domain-containing protein|nr:type IV pilin-like G/H family protein [Kaiparowitsia implicata GSE-PSE-MK54-09C]
MKTDLKAKFLMHLAQKKKGNEGFTLIELLVVIIIIGILAAIALPSFLNQANKARQAEAATYVGTMNRAQQAYFLENNQFAPKLTNLELGIRNTDNYSYNIPNATSGANAEATAKATPVNAVLKGFSGRTWVDTTVNQDATTLAIVCEGTVGAAPAVTGITACP